MTDLKNITIIYPVIALVFLTAVVWFKMYYVRFSIMKIQNIKANEMVPTNRNLPHEIVFSAANFNNLCEMPILFYLVSILIFVIELTDPVFMILCSLYVVLRYAHSAIHTTYNKISHRFLMYFSSTMVLWTIWIRFSYLIVF